MVAILSTSRCSVCSSGVVSVVGSHPAGSAHATNIARISIDYKNSKWKHAAKLRHRHPTFVAFCAFVLQRGPLQSCPWVALTHGLDWVGSHKMDPWTTLDRCGTKFSRCASVRACVRAWRSGLPSTSRFCVSFSV